MNLKEEKEYLFNQDYSIKNKDVDRLILFCNELTNKTGIQLCTNNGAMFEVLPKVCNSIIKE